MAQRRAKDSPIVVLVSPDDTDFRKALEALATEGDARTDLDRIGDIQAEPDKEPHLSTWQGAREGEVSIVTIEEAI